MLKAVEEFLAGGVIATVLERDERYAKQPPEPEGVSPNIGIVDMLRKRYPDHANSKSTGVLRFAKAGQAYAKLDTNTGFYAAWTYKRDQFKGTRPLKYKVKFGKYNYR